ncbi:hypothetical protein TNCV_2012821 [Trichonephila clavipes]|uniref:Zinc knuckle domain-containing protein n=1 Tax=Trichonephila clavipes TaxID=2585209 RepID=A0A8X6RCN6_TRICX|nr:hypothetical protein TNCV_2012821 [Trichonephila clavipes]
MKTRCLKCGENHRTGTGEVKDKIKNPLCINCNAKGHMTSSTECPLFLKPRKGNRKSPVENLKRNFDSTPVTPGISCSQVLNPNKSHPMAARGNTSSGSDKQDNSKNETVNTEALNAIRNERYLSSSHS